MMISETHDLSSVRRSSQSPAVRRDSLAAASRGYLFAKRAFDLLCGLLGLVLASPVMLLVALWVRLDSAGPAIYRQERQGRGGRSFDVLKFRTMADDAEGATGPVWAAVGDSRVTRAGRVLRKLYLDELPQLINILRGDMSFVGPRPERPFFYPRLEERIPGFSSRCLVRPGLTGLAQVRQYHYASVRATRRKFQYDMFYIRHRSFGFDAYLIWETFRMLIREVRGLLQ